MEFEERLVLIERVAKTLLDAMIDCILYTCVCICVCARCEECIYDGGRAGSFQIQRVCNRKNNKISRESSEKRVILIFFGWLASWLVSVLAVFFLFFVPLRADDLDPPSPPPPSNSIFLKSGENSSVLPFWD